MSLDQGLAIGGFAVTVITLCIAIGLWRGRQEAADKAAAAAIKHTETVFGLRLEIVDRDMAALKQSIADVKARMADSEAERREEFQRLHKIGNETHGLIVQHLTKLQESYIPRAEYEARHDDVERRVSRLEQKS